MNRICLLRMISSSREESRIHFIIRGYGFRKYFVKPLAGAIAKVYLH